MTPIETLAGFSIALTALLFIYIAGLLEELKETKQKLTEKE